MDNRFIYLMLFVALIFGTILFLGDKKKDNNVLEQFSNVLPTQEVSVKPQPTIVYKYLTASSSADASSSGQTKIMDLGLKVEDIVAGQGREVKSGDTVSINYVGTLENGQKFDSSYDSGKPFITQIGVGRVIQGWDIGIIGMKMGGKRKLTIPPELGYGSQGAGGVIPPNATLIFEVELMEIH